MRNCIDCHAPLPEGSHPNRKRCDACAGKHERNRHSSIVSSPTGEMITAVCTGCGETFLYERRKHGRLRIYCDLCTRQHQLAQQKKHALTHRVLPTRDALTCPDCGTIVANPAPQRRYCPLCALARQRKAAKALGYQKRYLGRPCCQQCGNLIPKKKLRKCAKDKPPHFCNRACLTAWRHEHDFYDNLSRVGLDAQSSDFGKSERLGNEKRRATLDRVRHLSRRNAGKKREKQ